MLGDGGTLAKEVTRGFCDLRFLAADSPPEVIAQLAQETYQTDLLQHMLLSIPRLDFEARKDVVQVFNHLLRRQIGSRFPTVEYLSNKPEIVFTAFKGYDNEEIALNTGMILKEMLRHEPLAKILLHSEQFYNFPVYIEGTTFGVSCDAYTNLKETLTRHKPMVADFLDKNYDRVRVFTSPSYTYSPPLLVFFANMDNTTVLCILHYTYPV